MNHTKLKLTRRQFILLFIFIAGIISAYGQANPEEHSQGMERIKFLEGTWGRRSYKKLKDGTFEINRTISVNDPDTSRRTTFKPIFNGNYYSVNGKVSFNFSMTIGYDQWRDKYVLVSFEDGPGLIDIYQGDFNKNGDLVLSNFEAGTHYVQDGVKYYNRMTFSNITDKEFTWFIDGSTDGSNWTRLTRYDLIR